MAQPQYTVTSDERREGNGVTYRLSVYCGVVLALVAWWVCGRGEQAAACADVVLSAAELARLDGRRGGGRLCLAVLGRVFDVSSGRAHYAPGAPYHSFLGGDRSRSFVDGEFGGEEGGGGGERRNRERVLDLSCADLQALQRWLQTYHTKYTYVGVVQGVYYDAAGCPTAEHAALHARLSACAAAPAPVPSLPPCNVEWSARAGSHVWCSTNSGGVSREWAGVPRVDEGGACVCARGSEAGRLALYPHCAPDSAHCYTPPALSDSPPHAPTASVGSN